MTAPALDTAPVPGVVRSAVASVGGQAARLVLQAGGVIVTARLLMPADFGVMAMVAVTIGLGEVVRDFGLTAATVQAATVTDAERTNLFWFNTVVGAVFSAGLFVGAPLLGAFYHTGAVVGVARAASIVFVLNGVGAQYRTQFNRSMRFGTLARIDLTAVAASLAVSIGLASVGVGPLALAAQQVTFAAVGTALLLCRGGWAPGWVRWDTSIRSYLRFGSHLVASNVLGYATRNVDSLLLAHRYGPRVLGGYDRAYQLLMLPLNNVNTPLSRVALPALSRLRGDRDRFLAFAVRAQTGLMHLVVGGLCLGIAVAGPALPLLLGPQWTASARLFQILAVGGVLQTTANTCDWMFLGRGLSREYLRYTVLTRPLVIAGTAVGALWGATGVACGFVAGSALLWPSALLLLHRASGLPLRPILITGLRILAGHLSCAALGLLASSAPLPPLGRLTLAAAVTLSAMATLFLRRGAV